MTDCSILLVILSSYQHRDLRAIATLILVPFIILFNTVLIVGFIATKQATQNATNLFILCLSVSDLLNVITSVPMLAYILRNIESKNACILGNITAITGSCLGNFSAILTVFIAVDRYLHMNPNIQNQSSKIRKIFKVSNVGYLVTVTFMLTLSVCIIGWLASTHPNGVAMLGFLSVSVALVYALSITSLYIRGYKRISSFAKENPVYRESHNSGECPQYVRSLHKTVLVIVLVTCATYLPYSLVQGVTNILSFAKVNIDSSVLSYLNELILFMVGSSYLLNCLAVLYLNKKLKKWIMKKMGINGNETE